MTLSPPRRSRHSDPAPSATSDRDGGLGARLRESDLWRAHSVGALMQDPGPADDEPAGPRHGAPDGAAGSRVARSRSRSRRADRSSADGADLPAGAGSPLDSRPSRPADDPAPVTGRRFRDESYVAGPGQPMNTDHESVQLWAVADLADAEPAAFPARPPEAFPGGTGPGRRWAELDVDVAPAPAEPVDDPAVVGPGADGNLDGHVRRGAFGDRHGSRAQRRDDLVEPGHAVRQDAFADLDQPDPPSDGLFADAGADAAADAAADGDVPARFPRAVLPDVDPEFAGAGFEPAPQGWYDAGPDFDQDVEADLYRGGAADGPRADFAGLDLDEPSEADGDDSGELRAGPGFGSDDGEGSPVPEDGCDLRSISALVDRLDVDDVVDADDVVAKMAALGLDDDLARERYGMSMRGVGVSVLTHLAHRRAQRGMRRAPAKRPYLIAAVVRCTLYLGPLAVAVAGAGVLGRLAWPVAAVTLLLGWGAAQALTGLGVSVARTAGPASAARLVGGGFLATAGVWAAFVWVAPSAWLGPSRVLALVAGIGGLTALSTVTAGLVTRAEAGVIRWSLPCWLLGAVSFAASFGGGWAAQVPVETLLPAAIVVAAVRAYRPVIGRSVPDRPPLERGTKRRGLGYLIVGLAQATAVVLLWQAGATALAALPLLLAVPVLETLVGWHLYQVETGLDATESARDYRRHVRSVAITTLAALLPPLAAGIALTAAAYRLPYGPATRDGVLALAAGTLLSGLLAATFLIAARGHTLAAASLATAAPLAMVILPLAPLPAAVAAFAATHLLGLLTVAHIAADHRRTP